MKSSTSSLRHGATWSKHSSTRFTRRVKPMYVESVQDSAKPMKKAMDTNDPLDCGKPVNFTYYDYLIGVAQRFNHPLILEPEVAYLFLKNKDEKSLKNFDINALEKRLKRAKKEKPKSVHLYNQIGNYWRIVGNARNSSPIEFGARSF